MKKENKPLIVAITEKGSLKALPSIWYGGKTNERFKVVTSKRWPSVYEVIDGPFTGKVIVKSDCKPVADEK